MTYFARTSPSARFCTTRDLILVVIFACLTVIGSIETLSQVKINAGLDIDGPANAVVRSGDTVFVGGRFTSVGQRSGGSARFDGLTLPHDRRWPVVQGTVNAIISDGVGGYYIGGLFSRVGRFTRSNLARLSATFQVDTAFKGATNAVVNTLFLWKGTLYVGGTFGFVIDSARALIAALNPTSGVIRPTFNARVVGAAVHSIDTLGTALAVGGSFSSVQGQRQPNFALIDPNSGGLVSRYAGNATVHKVKSLDSGTYLAGDFTQIGLNLGGLVRFPENGSADTSFPEVEGDIRAIIEDGAGGWFIGGFFGSVDGWPCQNIARIGPNKRVDTTWRVNVNSWVTCFARRNDTLYIGGLFSRVNDSVRPFMAAVINSYSQPLLWSQFYAQGKPALNGSVNSLTLAGNRLVLAGTFGQIGTREQVCTGAYDIATHSFVDWPSADNWLFTSTALGDTVYLGGAATSVGYTANNLAKFQNGADQRAPEFPGTNGPVWCASPATQGGVYVGGNFSFIGGSPRTRIALVASNGIVDPVFFSEPNSTVRSILRVGSRLYVGGDFTTVDGVNRTRLARLDPVTGELDLTWNAQADANVLAIRSSGHHIVITGEFTSVNSRRRVGIALLDTVTGQLLDFPSADGPIFTTEVVGTSMYFGGNFGNVGYNTGGVTPITNTNLAPNLSFPYVNGAVNAMVPDGSGGWFVGGSFFSIGDQNIFRLARVRANGSVDATFTPSPNGMVTSLAVHGGRLYVGGFFTEIAGEFQPYCAALDLASGAFVGEFLPVINGAVSVLHPHNNDLWLGGLFTGIGQKSQAYLGRVSATDGTWREAPSIEANANAFAPTQGSLFVGSASEGAGFSRRGVSSFTSSSSVPKHAFPDVTGDVYSFVPESGGGGFMLGDFILVGTDSRSNIARIRPDGTLNSTWDLGTSGLVRCGAIHDGILYIGGDFTAVGGQSRQGIAAVDIATETVVAAFDFPMNGSPKAMRFKGDTLLVVGDFTTVDGLPNEYLWSVRVSDLTLPFMPNVSGIAHDLDIDENQLYLGFSGTQVGYRGEGLALVSNGKGKVNQRLPRCNGVIQTILSDGSGGWYLGGTFTSIGGTSRNRLALIDADGNVDQTFNPNCNGTVNALALNDGTLYIGGEFTSVGGSGRNRLAAVDAGTGTVQGFNPDLNGTVHVVRIHGGSLYVGGGYTAVGTTTRSRIAKFDLSAGTLLAWNPNSNGDVKTIRQNAAGLYLGGEFTNVGGQNRNYLAAVDTTNGNASAWNPNPNGFVESIDLRADTVFYAGSFTQVGAITRNRPAASLGAGALVAWNPNVSSTVNALVVVDSMVVLGGDFQDVGGESRRFIAKVKTGDAELQDWNPSADAAVHALAAASSGTIIGGAFEWVGAETRRFAAKFDVGQQELVVGDWNPDLNNVCFAVRVNPPSSTVYLGGDFTQAGTEPARFLACVDNSGGGLETTWVPNLNGPVAQIGIVDSVMYAAGSFDTVQTVSCPRLAGLRLSDGTAKYLLGANNQVADITTLGADLFVSGFFDYCPYRRTRGVAKIDLFDQTIAPQDFGFDNDVYTLDIQNATLYAGGEFTSFNGIARRFALALDTLTLSLRVWSPNPNSVVNAVKVHEGRAWIGGEFDSLGNSIGRRLAICDTNTGAALAFRCDLNDVPRAFTFSPSQSYVLGQQTFAGWAARAFAGKLDLTDGRVSDWRPSTNWVVTSIQPAGSSMLLSGGFTEIGGLAQSYLAQTDTIVGRPDTTWRPQINNIVSDIALKGDSLFLGGLFSMINGQRRTNLGAISRQSASTLDWNASLNGVASVLEMVGTDLVVGGSFTRTSFAPRGSAFAIVASTRKVLDFNPGFSGLVFSSCTDGDNLWMGGNFIQAGGEARCRVAKIRRQTSGSNVTWNFQPWYNFCSTFSGSSFALAYHDGIVYDFLNSSNFAVSASCGLPMAGAFSAVNGELMQWFPAVDNSTYALTASGNGIVAGGDFRYAHTRRSHSVQVLQSLDGWGAACNGTRPLAITTNGSVFDLVMAPQGAQYSGLWENGSLVLAGAFSQVNGTTRTGIAAIHPNAGGQVQAFNQSIVGGPLRCLAIRDSHLIVGGEFTSIGTSARLNLGAVGIPSLVPSEWKPEPSGAVSTVLSSLDGLYVGGEFRSIEARSRTNAFAYNARDYKILEWAPQPNGEVYALSIEGPSVFLGGDFTLLGASPRAHLAKVNRLLGEADMWNPGANGRVVALSSNGTNLYVGGAFTQLGGLARGGLGAVPLSGSVPTSFNPNPNGSVLTILAQSTDVFVGGAFTAIGGQARGRLASFRASDGALNAWNPNATNGRVRFISDVANHAYQNSDITSTIAVTGDFTSMSGSNRNGLAIVSKSTGVPTSWNPATQSIFHAGSALGYTVYTGGAGLTSVNGEPRTAIAAIDSNGNPTPFAPALESACCLAINAISSQPGGLTIAGDFDMVDGDARHKNLVDYIVCPDSLRATTSSDSACAGVPISLGIVRYVRFDSTWQQWTSFYESGTRFLWQDIAANTVIGTDSSVTVQPDSSRTYRVTVMNQQGCSQAAEVRVVVKARPSGVPVSSAQHNTCVGDTVTLSLSGSEIGVQYQVQRNGTDVGGPFAGTGGAISRTILGVPGGRSVYRAFATLVGSGCTRLLDDSVVVTRAPSLTSFTPATGSSGTVVTFTGRYFTGATAVSFGGVAAQSFTVLNDSVISATVGSGAAGKVRVTVGSCFGESATDFTIDATDITVRAYMQNLYSGGVHQVVPAMVELWSGSDLSAATLVHRAAGTVSTGGEVKVSIQGLVTGQYWLVYRYAGHLAVASSSRVSLTAGTPATYDFTDAASKALGFESTVNIGGVFHLRGGDPDGNADINGTDYGSVTTNFGQSTSVPAATLGSAGTGSPVTAVTVTSYMQNYFSGGVHRLSSVMIELRSGVDLDASTLVGQQSVVLGANGQATASFAGLASGQYWLVIRHGAHLAVASANRLSVTAGTPVSYNFSDAANRAFGFETTVLSGGVYLIRCGDSNGDGDISGTDYSPVTTNFGRSAVVPEP